MSVPSKTTFMRRVDEIASLQRLLPYSDQATKSLDQLAMNFSAPAWKELFIRYWQQQARCASEVRHKIKELGGTIQPESYQDNSANVFISDRSHLLQCLNQQTQLVSMYSDLRQLPHTFDVRLMLQHHLLQSSELIERLRETLLTLTRDSAQDFSAALLPQAI